MQRSATVGVLTCAIIALGPVGPAAAAGDGRPTDPSAGSPAGTVYEIPLDAARGDAAPRANRQADPAGPAGSPAADASPIRSENNFGSSSRVPGVAARASGHGAGEAGAATAGGEGDPGGGAQPPTAAGAVKPGPTSAGDATPSRLVGASLLGLIAVVGVGAGVVAARTRRSA
ncbi:MAG: hypothetical protein WD993_10485 [Thermoleophilaceae bacterium]